MSGEPQTLALRLPDGSLVELRGEKPLVIGTAPGEGGLTLTGAGVATRHAAVARLKSGGYGVKVIAADARTEIDGRAARQARLQKGSELTLGETTLEVVDPAEAAPKPDPLRGGPERVDGFRLERMIGKGGMGRVFLAVQESLQRQVALKLLRPELANDADFVARFQAEARAAAALSHPNVVTVYDVGQADGHHYLALEYMERGSLEERLAKDGPLPWRAVLGILRDAAAGLEFAEQKGLVHRDVKPANLMQTATGTTKLVDLGLATSIAATSESDGVIRGTPHFMSPEQVRGAPLDVRSDLFSLGSTAYRLLTGKTPFEGDNSKAIVRAVVQEQPRPVESIVEDVPRALQGFLDALMQKDPAERPATAAAARARAEELIASLGGGAGDTATSSGGSRRAAAIAVVVVILAIAGSVPFLLGGDPPADTPQVAQVEATEPDLVDGPVDDVDDPDDVAPSEQLDPASAAAEAEERLERAEDEARAALEQARGLSDPDERATALRAVASRFLGTDASQQAASEADAIEGGEAESEDTPTDAVGTVPDEVLLAALRSSARDADDVALEPQVAFFQLERAEPPAGVLADERFAALRRTVELELEAELRLEADALLDAADEEFRAGRLDVAADGWRALEEWLTVLPPELEEQLEQVTDDQGNTIEEDLDAGELPTTREGVLDLLLQDEALESAYSWRLAQRIELVRARLEQLDAVWRDQYVAAMRQRDQARLANELRGGAFEQQLAAFELAAAASTLESLASELRSEQYSQAVGALGLRVREASAMFDLLASEYEGGAGWRRSATWLPGSGRTAVEVVSVNADGFVAETEQGRKVIPWTAFAADPDAVRQLFTTRFTRDLTAKELIAAADLIGLAAANAGLAPILAVLDPEVKERLSPGEAEEVLAMYDRAIEFVEEGDPGPVVDERAAVALVCQGLRAVDDEDWPLATFAFEQLLERYPTALFTLLLSDGSPGGEPVAWPPLLDAPEPWSAPAETGTENGGSE